MPKPGNAAGALVGYCRVSTTDQSTALQIDALEGAGCSRIFQDAASGALVARPQLDAALDFLREGDTLVVWRLDRLARSLKHLMDLVALLDEKGVGFKSLQENIDTTTPSGMLFFHLFGAFAQFERDLIRERTAAGLAAARARGRVGGRKPALSPKQVEVARNLYAGGEHTVSEIAKIVGVSRATVYRHLGASKDRITG